MFAGIVIETHGTPKWRSAERSRVCWQGSQAKDKRPREQHDAPGFGLDLLVEIAIKFGFGKRYKASTLVIEEERFFVFVELVIGNRVGIFEADGKSLCECGAELPKAGGEKIGFTGAG
jgi:hypothetical protein